MIDGKALAFRFVEGLYVPDIESSIWKDAFSYIVVHQKDLIFKNASVHMLWIVNGGHIRDKVRDDELILKVLQLSLPSYSGDGLLLYRGECKFLYEQGKIGFCWTPVREVAEMFAKGLNALESGGVLLEAYAPAAAILSAPNEHSASWLGEFEYTCDPKKLERINLLQCFSRSI